MDPATTPVLASTRLLDQLRERIRYKRYSVGTEERYMHWARFFVHGLDLKHPRNVEQADVEAILNRLDKEREVLAPTRIGTYALKNVVGQTTNSLHVMLQD